MPAKVSANNLFGNSKAVKQQSSNTVKPHESETVEQQNGNAVKPEQEKVSFYLEIEKHSDKLDQLCFEYKKRTGRRINRQDVVRKLIENSKVEDLL